MAAERPEFDVPIGTVFPVDQVTVRLDDKPHPYQLANADEIEAHWQIEAESNPALFDGEVIMLASLRYRDGCVEGVCHPIRFATFLHWRASKFAGKGFHIFASAMPVSRDGALIAVQMGAHTANAGRVYFAAGSFERIDFRDGIADLPANMHREVAEETGIELGGLRCDSQYHALCSASGLTLVRRYYLDADAGEAVKAIRSHIAGDGEPEISDAVIIRREGDVPVTAPAHMVPLARWHFDAGHRRGKLES